ncbi:MAG: M20/M25/M40 family metallo-hydrolase [Bryobacteraceae bacterium]
MIESRGLAAALVTGAFMAAVAVFAIQDVRPPAAVPSGAPSAEFSSGRAMNHLRAFAREPHPVGSAAHNGVRSYIVGQIAAIGVQAQIETAPVAMDARWGFPLSAATISNVVARLPGTSNTHPLALMCHYDSVASGPGAGDDGEGVAVLLETLRALRNGPPLRNDLIFLFTDGEEAGLLGAKAFVDAHPRDVGLVLNFEARGTSGPAFMFETSPGNGWIVRQLAAAAPYVQANSMSYEAYRNMPNDTDLTIFKKAGIAGLNFAFIGDVTNYHTRLDDPAHVDERSIQHQGSYALALARRFGNEDLSHVTAPDVTYFGIPALATVIYPVSWSMPLSVVAAVLLGVVAVFGIVRGRVSVGEVALGFLLSVLAVAIAAAGATGFWRLMLAWHPDFRQMLQGDPYHAGVYRLAVTAFAMALVTALFDALRRRIANAGLWAGALLLWLLLAVLTAAYAPGAAYLFTWPLVFAAAGLGYWFAGNPKTATWASVAVLCGCAIPALLLVPPTIDQLFVAMTMRMAAIPALVSALLLGILIPHLRLFRRWSIPAAALLVCVICVVAGSTVAGFDRRYPKPDSLFYGFDADTGKATWFSGDFRPEPWTAPALGAHPLRTGAPSFVPFLTWSFFVNNAQPVTLPAPTLAVLQDGADGSTRSLRLRIASARGAAQVFVYGDPRAEVLSAEVNGKPLGTGLLAPADKPGLRLVRFRRWSFVYFNPSPEGIELHLRVKNAGGPLHMEVIDQTYSLDGILGAPARPADTIPLPWTPDSVYVRKSFEL